MKNLHAPAPVLACAAMIVLAASIAGCSGGANPQVTVPSGGQPSATSATTTLSLSSTAEQNLPVVAGISSSLAIPANNAPGGATLAVTVSTVPTSDVASLPVPSLRGLLYFALKPSASATLHGLPKFSATFPSAPQSQGQFYAWGHSASGNWIDLGSVTIAGSVLTFGGSQTALNLQKDVQMSIALFTGQSQASCPTPAPTSQPTVQPSGSPTSPPTTGPTSSPTTSPSPCPESTNGVPLGTDNSYAILASSTVTNSGPTLVKGDLGVSPGTAVTGFGVGNGMVIDGAIHAGDAAAAQAQTDLTTAYNNAAGRLNPVPIPADIGGTTITPGVYNAASSLQITGNVTLDGQGDPNSVFIFQIPSTLVTAVNSSVTLINGATPCNVFWQVGSSATVNAGSIFSGTILAQASISLGSGAIVDGRLLARTGAVTLLGNTITNPEF